MEGLASPSLESALAPTHNPMHWANTFKESNDSDGKSYHVLTPSPVPKWDMDVTMVWAEIIGTWGTDKDNIFGLWFLSGMD